MSQYKDEYVDDCNLSQEMKDALLKAIKEKDKKDWKSQAELVLSEVCGIPTSIKFLSNITNQVKLSGAQYLDIYTRKTISEEGGSWQGEWKKKSTILDGKSPSHIFIYWGSIGIYSKEHLGNRNLYLLKVALDVIYLRADTRIMAIFT